MHNVIWTHKFAIWQWIVDVYEKWHGQKEAAKIKFLLHILNVTELITKIRISIIKHFKYLQIKYYKKFYHNNTEGLSQYLNNLMHKICSTLSFISCLYMFRAHVLITRRSKLHYTASGIITPIGVMIPEAV